MKKQSINQMMVIMSFVLVMISTAVHAGSPLWTYSAPNPSTVNVSAGGSATVTYTVTSQTDHAKSLVIETNPKRYPSTPGLTASACNLPTKKSTCTLTITIDGSQLPANGIHTGPYMCQANSNGTPNANQCYQPSTANSLNITKNSTEPTSLGVSVSSLALSVNDKALNAALTGSPRIITITNTGANPAYITTVTTPIALPTDTNITGDTCSNTTLGAGLTCIITITPGKNASTSCTTGLTPTASTVSVNASNATSASASVVVLSYGCIYQDGFVYSVNDTTSNTGSIGGKVAALTDNVSGPTSLVDTTPNWGGFGCDIGTSLWNDALQGANDGSTNSANIVSALTTSYSVSPCNLGSAVALTEYAAGRCSQYTTSSDAGLIWYLPSICELSGASPGINCVPGTTSMLNQLWLLSPAVGGFVNTGYYWSSTEPADLSNAPDGAWYRQFSVGGNQGSGGKNLLFGVRCSRALSI